MADYPYPFTVVARKGLASQVPTLQEGELGYDINTKSPRYGDGTSTPPRVLTDKSTGEFDLRGINPLFSPEFLQSLSTPGPSGWSPVLASEEREDGRVLLQIQAYTGGVGSPPTDIGYYIRSGQAPTPNHNLATDFRGRAGKNGSPPIFKLSIDSSGILYYITSDDPDFPVEAIINEDGELVVSYGIGDSEITTTLGRVVPLFQGPYNNAVQYVALDEVRYNGGLYRAKFNETIVIGTLPTDSSKWDLVGYVNEQYVTVSLSDLVTPLEVDNALAYQPLPYAFTLVSTQLHLSGAQVGGALLTVDIKWWDGDSWESIFSAPLTIDNGEYSSISANTPAVLTKTSFNAGARLRFDITQVGDGTAVGAKVILLGYRT